MLHLLAFLFLLFFVVLPVLYLLVAVFVFLPVAAAHDLFVYVGKRFVQFTGPPDAAWKSTVDRWAIGLAYGFLGIMLIAAVIARH